ncbi:MAG TPA: hypothetical protein VI942_06600, partial [Thermoanaerobaculia bacterium]|nr:hypothetical protein [Thermoanaerobaculia bacterium]
ERLELERGALYVDSAGAPAARAPEIVTPLGSFRELGTQFEVRLLEGDGARLRVREGAVAFERAAPAGAGEELLVAADGELRRGPVATHGEAWDWVLETAPMPAIEGWTLVRYLDWLARETGWRIAFADAGAAKLARTVVLHGSIERLTPAESSAAVLGSAGFEQRLDDGILSVAVRTPK